MKERRTKAKKKKRKKKRNGKRNPKINRLIRLKRGKKFSNFFTGVPSSPDQILNDPNRAGS